MSLFDGSECGHHVNATDAGTVLHFQSHVAFLAPGRAPVVADKPVLVTTMGIDAETYDDDGVVKVGAALGRVKDANSVLHEQFRVALDSGGDGLLGHRSL